MNAEHDHSEFLRDNAPDCTTCVSCPHGVCNEPQSVFFGEQRPPASACPEWASKCLSWK